MTTPDDDDVMIPEQVAAFLKVHLKTVYKLAAEGKIPGRRVGRMWRFPRKEIEALVRKPKGNEDDINDRKP